jgi:hypothetical protein
MVVLPEKKSQIGVANGGGNAFDAMILSWHWQ